MFEPRGEIEVKGKGRFKTYFILRALEHDRRSRRGSKRALNKNSQLTLQNVMLHRQKREAMLKEEHQKEQVRHQGGTVEMRNSITSSFSVCCSLVPYRYFPLSLS